MELKDSNWTFKLNLLVDLACRLLRLPFQRRFRREAAPRRRPLPPGTVPAPGHDCHSEQGRREARFPEGSEIELIFGYKNREKVISICSEFLKPLIYAIIVKYSVSRYLGPGQFLVHYLQSTYTSKVTIFPDICTPKLSSMSEINLKFCVSSYCAI